VLAGTTDVAMDTLTFEHMLQLKREWAGNNRGTAGVSVSSFTTITIQNRPEYANPRATLDVRVRKALAHGIDLKTFTETVWAGELHLLETIFHPGTDFYPAIDRAIVKYPYDPNASQRLMAEAGYSRAADGYFAGQEGKLTFSLQGTATRREPAPLSANWRQAGFDIQEQPLSLSQDRDPEVRAAFPALYVRASGLSEAQQMARYRASEVSSPETRWRGENVGGWKNPAFDQLVDAFNVTLDPNERIQQRVQIARLISDEVPAIMLTENPNMHAFLSTVKPVTVRPPYRTTGRITWNIHEWELAAP
jgi:peptide/nickel transport system substrate-binding protein